MQLSKQLLSRLPGSFIVFSEHGPADGNPPISETWRRHLFKRMLTITHMVLQDVAFV